ncbi:MAG: S1C family serine protease [Vulcanimicrobiota bacterium]
MKALHTVLALSLIWLMGCSQPTPPQPARADANSPSFTSDENNSIEVFERCSSSVVYVTNLAVGRTPFSLDVTKIPQGTGSGFVWDNKGTIVTNFHVVRGAQAVEVTLADRSVWKARPIGFEPDKDLAVLHIDAPPDKLSPIQVGVSDNLRVGQKVLAIGNPFGFDHTLTTGIISGVDREIESVTRRPITGVIQTDAAINPGNSGGPLLDSRGRLIGINTSIYSPSGAYAGIGFAVPVDTVKRLVPEILVNGKVQKAGLGIETAADGMARRLRLPGVLILQVKKGGPAAQAGLRGSARDQLGRLYLGDIIVGLNGQRIQTSNDLFRALDASKVGEVVTVEYLRKGARASVKVRLE